MKRVFAFLAVFAAQVTIVMLLARVVRLRWWWENFNVQVSDAFVFGLPAVLAFFGFLRFAFNPASSIKRLIPIVLAAILLAFIGRVASDPILLTTDKLLTKYYISRMQPRLYSDPRFAHVRLMDMSCDSDWGVMFPFLRISGSVASEGDRQSLLHILNEAHPPAHVDAVLVRVGNAFPSDQEFVRRLREDDTVQ